MSPQIRNQVLRIQPPRVRLSPYVLAICSSIIHHSGGLLTGKMLAPASVDATTKLAYAPGSRWDPKSGPMAAWYAARYAPLLDVVRELKEVTVRPFSFSQLSPLPCHLLTCALSQESHGITMSAAAQRWLQHHSALGPNDAVLMGVSRVDQVKPNVEDWYVSHYDTPQYTG